MIRIDDFVKSQLVLTAWRYSNLYGNGGHLTACLIMSCLANRQRSGWEGGNWLQILQNLPKTTAELEIPTGYPEVWEQSFVRLLHEVEGIYDGSVKDIANGGKYWCDLRKVETDFFKESILAQPEFHPRVADMNSFAVFK